MHPTPPPEPDPSYTPENRRATLIVVRVVWAMLLLGQVAFGPVVLVMTARQGAAGQDALHGQMLAIAVGVLIGAVGLGYFARNQSYKKHWRGHAVTPPGYFQGNLILLVALEGSSLLTLVMVMLGGQVFPMVLPAVVSLAIQCANYPTGAPMEPALPEVAREG